MPSTTMSSFLGGPGNIASFIAIGGTSSPSTSTLALTTPYARGSTGAALAWFFRAPETTNLTDIYCYVSSVTGTGATGGNINFEVREGASSNWVPGSTLTGSGTISVGSTTGWKTVTGLSISLTAGKLYSITLADPNGNATNCVTLSIGSGPIPVNGVLFTASTTSANGFSTGATASKQPYGAWKIGSNWYGGAAVDAMSTVTAGTYERGCRFQVPAPMTLIGICDFQGDITAGSTATPTFNLYADATATAGTALTSFSVPSFTFGGSQPGGLGIVFPSASWYDLIPGTWYRLVVKPSSSTTIPRKNTSAATVPASVKAGTYPLGGNCYWTDASSGSWVDDSNSLCLMGPLLVPSNASGGGEVSFASAG